MPSRRRVLQALAAVVQRRFPMLGIRRLALAVFPRGVVSGTIHQILWFEDGPVLIENVRISTSALPGSVIAQRPAGSRGTATIPAMACGI